MATSTVLNVFCCIAALAPSPHPALASTSTPGFAYTRKATPSTAIAATQGKVACRAEYWRRSDRKEEWPRMIPVASSVAKLFGSEAMEALYGHDLTVVQAMGMEERENDGYSSLIKESSAALVNAYTRQGFSYSPWRVKTLLIQSLVSHQAASAQAARFRLANQACYHF